MQRPFYVRQGHEKSNFPPTLLLRTIKKESNKKKRERRAGCNRIIGSVILSCISLEFYVLFFSDRLTCPSGRLTLKCPLLLPGSASWTAAAAAAAADLRELSELDRDRAGAETALRRVAPLPASRLLRSDGLLAQM